MLPVSNTQIFSLTLVLGRETENIELLGMLVLELIVMLEVSVLHLLTLTFRIWGAASMQE